MPQEQASKFTKEKIIIFTFAGLFAKNRDPERYCNYIYKDPSKLKHFRIFISDCRRYGLCPVQVLNGVALHTQEKPVYKVWPEFLSSETIWKIYFEQARTGDVYPIRKHSVMEVNIIILKTHYRRYMEFLEMLEGPNPWNYEELHIMLNLCNNFPLFHPDAIKFMKTHRGSYTHKIAKKAYAKLGKDEALSYKQHLPWAN